MDRLVLLLSSSAQGKGRSDDDATDRLSRKYTTAILILFAVVVSTSTYVGEPIACWVPAHFTGNHERYANDICWISDHFYLPFKEEVPSAAERANLRHISYYRWVPIFLLVQALLFYIPCQIWRSLNNKSGIDVNKIVETAVAYHVADYGEGQTKLMNFMVRQFDRYLGTNRQYRGGLLMKIKNCCMRLCCCLVGKKYGNYLVFLYLIVKILYVVNSIGQFFLLNEFLSYNYNMYGFNVISEALKGEDWTASHRFPRVTMCDFETRRVGNVHKYTVQCVLSINFFNEKIYLFNWWWLVLIAAATALNFIQWFFRILIPSDRRGFIRKHLLIMDKIDPDSSADADLAKRFVHDYLKQDGVFIIRLVGENSNGIVVSELVSHLFDMYKSKQQDAPAGPSIDTKAADRGNV